MPSPRVFAPLALASLALALSAGCSGGGGLPIAEHLQPLETFHWNEHPIAFCPPPVGWRREGTNSRELGVMFIKTGSVGEAISIGEYYLLARHDRRAELHQLATRVLALDDDELRNALHRARWQTQDTFSASEGATAAAVNECLEHAFQAMLRGDREAARREVEAAESAAAGLRYTLDDLLPEVEFRPERRQEPRRYHVTGRSQITLAGQPAIRIDFDHQTDEGLRRCSEVYVMHENHLFIASYIGLARNLPLYDQVIASIVFPPHPESGT